MYTQIHRSWPDDGRIPRIAGKTTFGVITGKPVSLGGSEGRDDATARGGWYVIREAAQDYGIHLENSTVAIQGFGNVGLNAAFLAGPLCGCKVIAVSDSKGGIYNQAGLDIGKVSTHKKKTGKVQDFAGSGNISNEELLELEVDILIPAALENVITKRNADKIRAKFVAEFANGPMTKEGRRSSRKEHPGYPGHLCNGGGDRPLRDGAELQYGPLGRGRHSSSSREEDEGLLQGHPDICPGTQGAPTAGSIYYSAHQGSEGDETEGVDLNPALLRDAFFVSRILFKISNYTPDGREIIGRAFHQFRSLCMGHPAFADIFCTHL
jgi:hypothetical protein